EQQPLGYFQGEYLLWFIRDSHYPVLLSGGADAARLQPLFGGPVDHDDRHGARFTAGLWLDPGQACGVEASGFFLTERAIRFHPASDQNPVLVRPFLDPTAKPGAGERAIVVTQPGSLAGRFSVDAPNSLWGVEANGRARVWNSSGCRLDLLAGF